MEILQSSPERQPQVSGPTLLAELMTLSFVARPKVWFIEDPEPEAGKAWGNWRWETESPKTLRKWNHIPDSCPHSKSAASYGLLYLPNAFERVPATSGNFHPGYAQPLPL